ncbi:MAG: MBL fold metallo-hydrolase [Chromatiales bacterium]|nr:MBL fold metallo-hydrolase [Chromatiales bacterium]
MSASYKLHTLELGPMANFVYVIEDIASRRAAVVDPAWEVEAIQRLAREQDLRITDILLTHSHHDHINGIDALRAHADPRLHLLKAEAQFWGRHTDLPTLHHGGDRIALGDTEIEVLHTPGHTPGSACYRLGRDLITGDTLFVFGCGRCDLAGGDPNQMFDTLRRLAAEQTPDTVIRPGHNYSVTPTSTIAEERAGNPFMHFDERAAFVNYRMHVHDRVRHEPYDAEPGGKHS